MPGLILRALGAGLAAALAGIAALVVAMPRPQGVTWELDRDLRGNAVGFYPVERDGESTFAWTGRAASFTLEGAPRDAPWTCTVRLRGGRPDGLPQPQVQMGADGQTAAALLATNSYQDVEVAVAAVPGRTGLRLSIAAEPVMVPGPGDARELGVQVDRLACTMAGASLGLPPRRALSAAGLSAGGLGAAAVLLGLSPPAAVAAAAVVAAAQAVPLSAGVGPYSSYPGLVARIAVGLALVLVLAGGVARWRGRPLHPAAAVAVTFVAGAALLELSALLHPAKPIVDAQFQAHRLEWVLDGRYFFTQPMPDGVRFPYAIALYVVAAPWAWVTSDHVTLLRVVVTTARALSAILLYPVVRRAGGSRVTAAAAPMLVYLVPLPYIAIGNANLTFAFGQSAAMIALAAAAAWRLDRRRLAAGAGVFALASLAFLSHVGIFPVLLLTLLALGALCWRNGGGDRRAAWVLLAAATCAAVFSVVVYYGRFGEAYQSLERVRARALSVAAGRGAPAAATPEGGQPPAPGGLALPARVVNAAWLGVRAFGWPLLALALAGAWRAWRDRARDRAVLAAVAVAAASLVMAASAVAAPVEPRFQRYTDEFIDRLSYAALPAVALFAARGLAWGWAAGLVGRIAALALLAASAALAARQWLAWLA